MLQVCTLVTFVYQHGHKETRILSRRILWLTMGPHMKLMLMPLECFTITENKNIYFVLKVRTVWSNKLWKNLDVNCTDSPKIKFMFAQFVLKGKENLNIFPLHFMRNQRLGNKQ